MKRSNTLIGLSWLVAVLALIAAGAGIFLQREGGAFEFTTLRGTTAQIYGQGLYYYDTVFSGVGFRGQDMVMLALGVPLLIVASILYARGSLAGGLLLMGTLGYVLYVYATMSLGAAYNALFLVYVAIFGATFFAFVIAFTSFDHDRLAARFSGLPHGRIALFMITCGLLTSVVWLEPIVTGLIRSQPPVWMDSYTTLVTYALDLALIVPCVFLSGWLIWRRAALGYLIASPLLILIVMLLPTITLNTALQRAAGIVFTPAEMIGPIAGFVILGLIAVWVVARVLRALSDPAQVPVSPAQMQRGSL
ncbi:MAG: hypothetical protein KF893_14485 [Caldilineaceae bacterium]|nr:hypothetical protein [Caldilineaceae bacterium]